MNSEKSAGSKPENLAPLLVALGEFSSALEMPEIMDDLKSLLSKRRK